VTRGRGILASNIVMHGLQPGRTADGIVFRVICSLREPASDCCCASSARWIAVEKLRRIRSLGLIEATSNAGACVGVLCAKPARTENCRQHDKDACFMPGLDGRPPHSVSGDRITLGRSSGMAMPTIDVGEGFRVHLRRLPDVVRQSRVDATFSFAAYVGLCRKTYDQSLKEVMGRIR